MKELSFRLTKNIELLPLLLTVTAVLLVLYWLYRKLPESKKQHSWSKKDIYYMLSVTSAYAIVSLWQLGSMKMPCTTWQPGADEQSFILEVKDAKEIDAIYAIYGEGDNNSNSTHYQLGIYNLNIEGSDTGSHWQPVTTLNGGSIYQYLITDGDWNYRYYRFTCTDSNSTLSEVGFRLKGSDKFAEVSVYEDPFSDSSYPASLVIDEQDTLVVQPTYFDQGYFDEVYHPRNAWEIANGQHMYASVHPLFGTCMIALSIKIFGMNPFAWRFPGALAGILMIPVLYAILKQMFKDERIRLFGVVLLASDFMHLTTSRIATLEPFSVLGIMIMFYYMICYFKTSFYEVALKKQLILLLKCGIAMGFAIATKWTACYSAVGLAILLFINLGTRYQEYRLEKKKENPNPNITDSFVKNFWTTIGWCFVFFIFIPVIIYWSVYLFTPVWRDGWSIRNVWNQNMYMYNYHSGLQATHPYQSTWYMWILDIRPIWYYSGTHFESVQHTIACFSNPLIAWGGFIAILIVFYHLFFKKVEDNDVIISIGYLTAILPWVLVERCVFAYHFYPTSIFMIIAVVRLADLLLQKNEKNLRTVRIYAILCVVIFILFLPVTTGFGTTLDYIHFLEWLPSWYFG